MYLAEFQTRSKRAKEGWAAFIEALKTLVNKAFPQLQGDAKEQIALNHYLGQISNHQIAFGVRQKCPKTLDEAVSATLELESYLILSSSVSSTSETVSELIASHSVAGVQKSQETMMTIMQKMMDRLDKLEKNRHSRHKNSHVGWGIVLATQTLLLAIQVLGDSSNLPTTTHLCQ